MIQPSDVTDTQTRAAYEGAPQEWSFVDCARTLYRRKAALAAITCLGILFAGLIGMAQSRVYHSQASLEVQKVNDNFLNLRDVYPTAAAGTDVDAAYLQTQVEMLQEDSLIEQVVRKLRLAELPEFQSGFHRSDKFRRILGLGLAPAPAERNAIEAVKKNLKVMVSPGSRIIRIGFDAREPQLAADISNTLAQVFIEQSLDARPRAAEETHRSLSLRLEALRNKIVKSEAVLNSSNRGSRPWLAYDALKREVDSNRRFYEVMARRVDEAGIASDLRQSNIRLIGPAQPAVHPYKPNLPLNLAIGMFGGLVLAIGCVLLREQTSAFLRAPGEAGTYLTVPELGTIPMAPNRGLTQWRIRGSEDGTQAVERAALEQRSSGLSESFRATVASILSAGHGDQPRVLVVTSSRPMEGKTTVVSNLGISLAEISHRVLLIDGDLRRPRLHKVFDQANSWGLSDVLREKNAIEELPMDALVKKTAVPHLSLLPSGAYTDNIFGLLCSGRMGRLLSRFREEFDYVLVDAPPCLEFADARILARYADNLLLVVRANHTDKETARAAVQRLLLDGIPVMGVILNRWEPAGGDIYSYGLQNGFARQGLP